MVHPFGVMKVNPVDRNDWELEYAFRREFGMSREEIDSLPIQKVNFFLALLKKEKEELEKSLQT